MNDINKFFIVNGKGNVWDLKDPNYRDEKILHTTSEYQKYWNKIKNGENFMLFRYGDGERMLMCGQKVRAQEGWTAPEYITELGKALQDTLKPSKNVDRSKIIYAITCPCCNSEIYFWYLQNLTPKTTVTSANIWINDNFKHFKKDFVELERDAVLITNYRGKGKQFGKLNIKKHYVVDDDCVNFWERESKKLIKQIIDEVGNENNLLFAFSAGPLSEPIMLELFKHNPNNCYIDFGSALNFIIHEGITRPFMLENNALSKKQCWIFNNSQLDLNVDVLLTAYKRPQVLAQQLEAIKNQTIKPKNILLYQDGIDSYYKIELNKMFLRQFSDYHIAKENTGVWQRFVYASKAAKSKYVCVFDDDTIPGPRWLENCYIHMQQSKGIYGTNGILLRNGVNYPSRDMLVAGWHSANEKIAEVDFVGHSWFVERDYLKYMAKKPYIKDYKYVGEDMCLSYSCQEHDIFTYVPPHPLDNIPLWGSLPQYGQKYGSNEVALSVNSVHLADMRKILAQMRNDGWKLLCERNDQYVQSCVPELSRRVIYKSNVRSQQPVAK